MESILRTTGSHTHGTSPLCISKVHNDWWGWSVCIFVGRYTGTSVDCLCTQCRYCPVEHVHTVRILMKEIQ